MTAPRTGRQARPDPATLALRYRAWVIAQGADFDLTRDDLADALDTSRQDLDRALRGEAWAHQLQRKRQTDGEALGNDWRLVTWQT